MGEGSKKGRYFTMCLNLNYYQFKRSRFSCTSTYMNPVVTTNQKPTVVTQKWRGKEHKHTTKENHQTKKEEAKRRNEQRKTTKTTRKQVIIISTNLSIITLNINGLNGPIKRHGVGDWIRKTRQESRDRASLVAQWLRICLLMQGTRVRALVWEDPTCHGAAGPVSHSY